MRKRILSIAVIIILAINLTNCLCSSEPNFPVSETGFPIGFASLSNGLQFYLGMNVEEMLQYWERSPYGSEYSDISVSYNDDGKVFAMWFRVECCAIVGNISVGDNIQSVIDGILDGIFTDFYHHNNDLRGRTISFFDACVDYSYLVTFWYDEDRIITQIGLSYVPEHSAWLELQEEQLY